VGVVDEDIAAVKAATDLVGIVGQYTQGKQVGRRWVGLCPFHAEKSPSFSVNREDGLFHCLAGDTRVVTWDGVLPIAELAGRTVRVLSE
jgi:DNA primase